MAKPSIPSIPCGDRAGMNPAPTEKDEDTKDHINVVRCVGIVPHLVLHIGFSV
jgi:hypothetical protein